MDAICKLAENYVNSAYEDLPEEVRENTKKEILDLLGVMLAGFNEPGTKELFEITMEWGGKEESTVIGTKQKVPAPNAAQLNATMAHALDFDDVHEYAVVHPGIAVIPVCLAAAERKGRLDGKELITSTALGVDMMCRLALATTPGESPIKTGWHLTTLYGFLVSAVATGRILGLDREKMVNAVGIAYHQCSGNGQCVKDGALTKRLGPGFAVRGGMVAALMAERGVTGAKDSLEGEMGLYRLYMGGRYDPDILTNELGKSFEGVNVVFKPYPCCRGIHPAIDAALAIATEYDLDPQDIREIRLFVSDEHRFLLCTPEEAKCAPRNPVDAQFSIPWGVATALFKRGVSLEDFSESAIRNRDILNLTSMMKVEVDKDLKRLEKVDPTRVEVLMKQGGGYARQVEDPLGSLQRPMSFDDCARKFTDCAGNLPDRRSERIIDMIRGLEGIDDIGEIIGLTSME